MVLVGVGDEEGLDLLAVLLEVRDVGDDEVDPEHLLVGEHQAAVDDDDLVAVLEDVHVLADLAHPAERDDAERLIGSLGGHLGPVHGLEEGELVGVGGSRPRARGRVGATGLGPGLRDGFVDGLVGQSGAAATRRDLRRSAACSARRARASSRTAGMVAASA